MKAFLVGFCCTCILFACFNFFFGETPSYREAVVVVKHGDTLWDIARSFYTTVEEICTMNSLQEAEISPGQSLLLVKQVQS